MTIVYACICRQRDAVILTEVCDNDVKTTVSQVMVQLMQHLRDHPDLFAESDMKTFVQRNESELDFFNHFFEACSAALGEDVGDVTPERFFHLYLKDGVFYCCLGDDHDIRDQKVNFAFLQYLHTEFTKMYRKRRIDTAHAYSMDQNFAPMIRSGMHYHNIHHNEIKQDEKVKQLLAKVENLRDVMGRNIHMLLQRGEKFDTILAKSDQLNADAQIFKKNANRTKQILCRKYYFTFAVFSFIILALLYMVLVGVCSFDLSRCKSNGQNNSYNNNNAGGNAQGNNDAGGGNRL